MRIGLLVTVMIVLVFMSVSVAFCQEDDGEPDQGYLIGGPLAGLKLPLFVGDNGDVPGHPGSIPDLMEDGEGGRWGPQSMAPVYELYPGSVELFRTYMQKYMPIRPFFDQQSMLKRWTAPDLPGAEMGHVENYGPPVYWVARHDYGRAGEDTGRRWDPRPVVRAKLNDPEFQLDLGELPVGLYCVRVVGAVETEELQPFRKPIFIRFDINDGADGETQTYRVRINYVDEFYSVAEIYFHAAEARAYNAVLSVDEGSETDLLIHDIILDDALAGCKREAIKKEMVFSAAPAERRPSALTPEERLKRDLDLWKIFPRINAQGGGSRDRNPANPHIAFTSDIVQFGAGNKTEEDIAQEWGRWELARIRGNGFVADLPSEFLVNRHLGVSYTFEDHHAGNPLPDPYPYKDSGAGLYYSIEDADGGRGRIHIPVADGVDRLRVEWFNAMSQSINRWADTGDEDAGRDGAIALIRFAYQFPAIDTANQIPAVASTPGLRGMDSRCGKRATAAFWLPHYGNYAQLPGMYDRIFSYVQGNEELAQSLGRFIPWVEDSEDVVELLDVYLMQTLAKRQMRYHYHTGPYGVLTCAAVLGDAEMVRPLIDWTFASAWKYPLKPAGLQNIMIVSHDRVGRSFIGSYFYATPAYETVSQLAPFKESGILPPEYDVTDEQLYPKPVASLYWPIETVIAGRDFPRIADVGGPDKAPWTHVTPKLQSVAAEGWAATDDPAFAYILNDLVGPKGYSDEEWREIQDAAQQLDRAPWLDLRSRIVSNWITVLESGVEKDRPEYRSAAYLRTGVGYGHHHDDALDLQIYAQGAPMTIDGGQRPGYSTPGDRATRVHNTVEVNGGGALVQSWPETLSDVSGARYMKAAASPPRGSRTYNRQVALIDVDEGGEDGDQIISPNVYVFDVFRVAGGNMHTYCFHATVNDDFEVTPALEDVPADAQNADQSYLRAYNQSQESWKAGDAGENVIATWRMNRGGMAGREQAMALNFSPDSPRKFTRLHLLGTDDLRILSADSVCTRWDYRYTVLHAQKRGENLDTAFAGIIEPYSGDPFITRARRISPDRGAENEVAVEVVTADGRRDLCFADGSPAETRTLAETHLGGPVRVSGEFAFVSVDDDGLFQAALTGGSLLETPMFTIKTDTSERVGQIREVDYRTRKAVVDGDWSGAQPGRIVSIVTPGRRTAYTIEDIEPMDGGATLTLKGGADFYRSIITEVDADESKVTCKLEPAVGSIAGLTEDFTASNDEQTKFWRADYAGGGTWQLDGDVTDEDFADARALRIWEYGVGDEVRQSAYAGIKRVAPGIYEVTGDVDMTVTIGQDVHQITANMLKDGPVQIEIGD